MFLQLTHYLPDNFVWILEYFSRYAFVAPQRLYSELVLVEETVARHDPSFFGKPIQGGRGQNQQTRRSVSKSFRDILRRRSKSKWNKRVRKKLSDEDEVSNDDDDDDSTAMSAVNDRD